LEVIWANLEHIRANLKNSGKPENEDIFLENTCLIFLNLKKKKKKICSEALFWGNPPRGGGRGGGGAAAPLDIFWPPWKLLSPLRPLFWAIIFRERWFVDLFLGQK